MLFTAMSSFFSLAAPNLNLNPNLNPNLIPTSNPNPNREFETKKSASTVKRRRRDIFVAQNLNRWSSSVRSEISLLQYAAPTALAGFGSRVLQRCRAYGAWPTTTQNQTKMSHNLP
jgi:hypothetical protein